MENKGPYLLSLFIILVGCPDLNDQTGAARRRLMSGTRRANTVTMVGTTPSPDQQGNNHSLHADVRL